MVLCMTVQYLVFYTWQHTNEREVIQCSEVGQRNWEKGADKVELPYIWQSQQNIGIRRACKIFKKDVMTQKDNLFSNVRKNKIYWVMKQMQYKGEYIDS